MIVFVLKYRLNDSDGLIVPFVSLLLNLNDKSLDAWSLVITIILERLVKLSVVDVLTVPSSDSKFAYTLSEDIF